MSNNRVKYISIGPTLTCQFTTVVSRTELKELPSRIAATYCPLHVSNLIVSKEMSSYRRNKKETGRERSSMNMWRGQMGMILVDFQTCLCPKASLMTQRGRGHGAPTRAPPDRIGNLSAATSLCVINIGDIFLKKTPFSEIIGWIDKVDHDLWHMSYPYWMKGWYFLTMR